MFCNIASANNDDTILQKNFSERLEYFDRILDSLNRNTDSAGTIHHLNTMEHWAHGKNDKELEYGFRLLKYRYIGEHSDANNPAVEHGLISVISEIMYQSQFTSLKVFAMHLLSDYYWRSNKRGAALGYGLKAYNIYSKIPAGELPVKFSYMYELANKIYYFRDYTNTIKILYEVKELQPRHHLPGYHNILNLIGLSYRYMGIYDSAEHYFKEALKVVEENDKVAWSAILNGNLGKTYYMQNRLDEALPLLENDVHYCLDKKMAIDNGTKSLAIVGDIYLQKGNVNKAFSLLQRANELVKSNGYWKMYGILEYVYPALAKVYAAKGNQALAYAYMDSTMRVKDSLSKERDVLILAGAQNAAEAEKYQTEYEKKKLSDSIEHIEARKTTLIKLQRQRTYTYAGAIIIAFLLGFSYFIYKERRKSDALLLNILPSEIAEELKKTGSATTRYFDDVTILFTDFVNFTGAGERMSSEALINELNTCFREFDIICSRHNIEKIKTIGDAYLAVSGLPMPDTNHAENVALASIEILHFMQERRQRIGDATFEIRIGIHSGSVVAGIVGVKKFAYDIWGDTVNTAARMEQNSEPGRINISQATYDLVKDSEYKFTCIYRGDIDAKNKGSMSMYFLDEIKSHIVNVGYVEPTDVAG